MDIRKIKVRYIWQDLYGEARKRLCSLLIGFFGLLWIALMVIVNILIRAYDWAVRAIRHSPCVAVSLTFLMMLFVTVAIHMQMKVRLTTAEWQRDSLERKLDSARVLYSSNSNYFKYQPYKSN